MRLVVAVVGRARNRALGEAIRDYEERAARYWPLDVREVREERASGPRRTDLSRRDHSTWRAIPQMTLVRDKTPKMQRSGSQEADWFEEWFGEDYLRIYQHRDEEEAEHAIELIVSNLPRREIHSVLDLGCGAGRHTKVLFERWWTVGLDLSMALLKVARKE